MTVKKRGQARLPDCKCSQLDIYARRHLLAVRKAGLPPLLSNLDAEESVEVIAGNSSHFRELQLMQLCQAARHFDHAGRLVPLSAKWHRREIGTVSLNQQAIKR